MQQVSPPPALDTFASALFALKRLPAGLWTLLTLSEIDRHSRKGQQATLDVLVRGMGVPKSKIWHCLVEAEHARLIRARLVRQHHPAYILTEAGRETLREAQATLLSVVGEQGVFYLNRGGAQIEQGGGQNDQGEPPAPESQNTTALPASVGIAPSPVDTPAPPVVRNRTRQPAMTH